MSKSAQFRQSAKEFWRGSHTVPRTRWTASSKWRPSFSTFLILNFGLYLFGTGEALFVQAGLGNGPWTVFSQGVSRRTGLPLGASTLLISAIVLLLWVPLKQRPGLGTIANMIVIAGALQIGISVIPAEHKLWLSVLMVLAGIIGIGAASGLYLTCGLGPGPRDGFPYPGPRLPEGKVLLLLSLFSSNSSLMNPHTQLKLSFKGNKNPTHS